MKVSHGLNIFLIVFSSFIDFSYYIFYRHRIRARWLWERACTSVNQLVNFHPFGFFFFFLVLFINRLLLPDACGTSQGLYVRRRHLVLHLAQYRGAPLPFSLSRFRMNKASRREKKTENGATRSACDLSTRVISRASRTLVTRIAWLPLCVQGVSKLGKDKKMNLINFIRLRGPRRRQELQIF